MTFHQPGPTFRTSLLQDLCVNEISETCKLSVEFAAVLYMGVPLRNMVAMQDGLLGEVEREWGLQHLVKP